MRVIRSLAFVALALLMASPVEAADKAKKKKKQNGPASGVVVEVKKDADKDTGTITIMTFAASDKKSVSIEPGTQRIFKINDATKFETVSGKKKDLSTTPVKFTDVVKGETVVVTATDDTASVVKIEPVAKKKKNK
jgi:hypothetical protein